VAVEPDVFATLLMFAEHINKKYAVNHFKGINPK
jgi:hypothetical protein